MFKKKKKGFREILFPFKKKEKKTTGIPVRIREEDHYAVLEPFGLSKQEIKPPKKFLQIEKKPSKEIIFQKTEKIESIKPKITVERIEQKEIKPKQLEVIKPKLVIQKTEPKYVKPERPVQSILPKLEQITKPEESVSKLPINHIETDIDRLMRIIDEKKVVDLGYLSKTLKISVDRLETWAKMLEDRGLIEIEYPIIGLPKLRKKECKKES